MRSLLLSLAILPAAATAQAPAAAVGVDRITLQPGETKAFTLQPGQNHRLLVPTDAAKPAAKAIVVTYTVEGTTSTLRTKSKAGQVMSFSVLADPDGDGGFQPAGTVADVPGNGQTVRNTWPVKLGTINVGDFTAGAHGTADHAPAGK